MIIFASWGWKKIDNHKNCNLYINNVKVWNTKSSTNITHVVILGFYCIFTNQWHFWFWGNFQCYFGNLSVMNWGICCLFSIGNGAVLRHQLYQEKNTVFKCLSSILYSLFLGILFWFVLLLNYQNYQSKVFQQIADQCFHPCQDKNFYNIYKLYLRL
jgi:hypothetical protein